ncbi:MAG: hypothetical protein R3C39_14650 [Dehalococcoidia bacterium]
MDRDGGWVELLNIEDDTPIGRGRLVVTLLTETDEESGVTTNRGQVVPRDDVWRGRLTSFHAAADAPALEPGDYRIRFEEGLQALGVHVEEWIDIDAREHEATLRSTDDEIPAVLAELGGS